MVDKKQVQDILMEVFPDLTGQKYKIATTGIYNALVSQPVGLSVELTRKSAIISKFLRDSTLYADQVDNYANNELLAGVAINAAQTGNIDLWRFVCMPELSLKLLGKTQYDKWDYNFNNPRYDTLKPAIPFDQKLIDGFKLLGVNPNMTLVLDDWEAPYLRTTDLTKKGYSIYKSLDTDEQLKAIEGLDTMRRDIRRWINQEIRQKDFNVDVVFFSELIDYGSFVDLIAEFEIEVDEKYTKILNQEIEFVRKSSPKISILECRVKAIKRIAQYAVEGAVLYPKVNKSIYLASEYPVVLVRKKLTLLADLPTLFYVDDKDVKNI